MKGFHLSEISNRNIMGHMADIAMEKSGRAYSASEARRIRQTLVQRTQYGASATNTPQALLSGPLSSPLAKMFLTYPMRSLNMVFSTLPDMANPDSYGKGLFVTMARGLGASAMVYQIGKGLVGADLSRGLYVDSATSLVGGDRLMDPNKEWLPLPPAVSVPVDFIRGIASEDQRLLADSVSRVIPGGVALSRLVGVLPEMGGPNPVAAVQKTYVNWNQRTPDGRVALYKGDGTLVSFESPAALVFKGLGLDFGAAGANGELDNYLNKQRDEIVKYRQRMISQVLANDMRGAEGTAQEFGKRFKGPNGQPLKLSFNQAQVRQFVRAREASRTERLLDRLPPETRPIYQQMVASTPGVGMSVTPQQLLGARTSSTRERPDTMNLDPRVIEEIRRRTSVGPAAQQEDSTFGSF